MRDILPPRVFDALHDRYAAGVSEAEATFNQHEADEDSLTGALGQAIATRKPLVFRGAHGLVSVNISYKKLRGRGRNAPEKITGADGLFQIEVLGPDGERIRTKSLPFQAKTEWRGKDSRLLAQAKTMEARLPGGVIIDYSKRGYSACTAQVAVAANGSRAQVDRFGSMGRLSQVLSKDFLECRIGKVGAFYDPERERIVGFDDTEEPLQLITTTVARIG